MPVDHQHKCDGCGHRWGHDDPICDDPYISECWACEDSGKEAA